MIWSHPTFKRNNAWNIENLNPWERRYSYIERGREGDYIQRQCLRHRWLCKSKQHQSGRNPPGNESHHEIRTQDRRTMTQVNSNNGSEFGNLPCWEWLFWGGTLKSSVSPLTSLLFSLPPPSLFPSSFVERRRWCTVPAAGDIGYVWYYCLIFFKFHPKYPVALGHLRSQLMIYDTWVFQLLNMVTTKQKIFVWQLKRENIKNKKHHTTPHPTKSWPSSQIHVRKDIKWN